MRPARTSETTTWQRRRTCAPGPAPRLDRRRARRRSRGAHRSCPGSRPPWPGGRTPCTSRRCRARARPSPRARSARPRRSGRASVGDGLHQAHAARCASARVAASTRHMTTACSAWAMASSRALSRSASLAAATYAGRSRGARAAGRSSCQSGSGCTTGRPARGRRRLRRRRAELLARRRRRSRDCRARERPPGVDPVERCGRRRAARRGAGWIARAAAETVGSGARRSRARVEERLHRGEAPGRLALQRLVHDVGDLGRDVAGRA